MTAKRRVEIGPRVQEALAELKELISSRFPDASFDVERGEDPEGVYLQAMMDIEDRQDVADAFIDRLVTMQVEEGLPVYVLPVRPPERNAEMLQRHRDQAPSEAVSVALPSPSS